MNLKTFSDFTIEIFSPHLNITYEVTLPNLNLVVLETNKSRAKEIINYVELVKIPHTKQAS